MPKKETQQAQVVAAAPLPIGTGTSAKPTYEERLVADEAKAKAASAKIAKSLRLAQGAKK